MRRTLSTARKLNLLYALELLDECVRMGSMRNAYAGSLSEQVVSEAISRAKRRRGPKDIRPRHDQLPIPGVSAC